LMIPFSPRKGFIAIHKNPRLGAAVVVFAVSALIYAIARGFSNSHLYWLSLGSREFHVDAFAYGFVDSLLSFVVLILFSTSFVKGVAANNVKYSANVIAYWSVWSSLLSSVLVFFSPSLAISGENIVYLAISLAKFLWFLSLFVVALSVANNAPLRRCWGIGFAALLVTSLLMSFVGAFVMAIVSLII
jgi:hypothetical protein